MIATLMAVVVLVVLGVIGGLLHAIVPPKETEPKQLLVRVSAGVVVAVFYSPVAIEEPTNLVAVLAVAPAVIGTAYWALDMLKTVLGMIVGKPPPA